MNKMVLLFIACLLMVVGITAGIFMFRQQYSSQDKKSTKSTKEVKIGIIYPLTGTSAPAGEDVKQGMELAVEIINNPTDISLPFAKTSGIPGLDGAQLTLIAADHKGDVKTAQAEVERLFTTDGVSVLMGSYNSAITAAASEKAEQLQIPFINPDSTSPDLNKRGFKWFFRTTPDDETFAQNFFTFFDDMRKQGYPISKNIALVYENGLWGTGVARAEEKYATQNKYNIVANIPYDSKKTDFSKETSRLIAARPDIILQASYEKDGISWVDSVVRSGIPVKGIVGMDAGFVASGFLKTLGNNSENILSREVWSLDMGTKKPIVTKVNTLFKQRYNKDMNGNSARGFTAIFVLADALNRARSTDKNDVIQALSKTKLSGKDLIVPWDGVEFDATNQNKLGKGIIVQVQNGKYYTVWPFSLAATKVIWPMR